MKEFDNIDKAFASTALDCIIDGEWGEKHRGISPKELVDGGWIMSYDDNGWVFGEQMSSNAVAILACYCAERIVTSLSDFKVHAIIEESYKKMNDLCDWLMATHGEEGEAMTDIDCSLRRFYPDTPDIHTNREAILNILLMFNKYANSCA